MDVTKRSIRGFDLSANFEFQAWLRHQSSPIQLKRIL
jgi:hypothetical protein